MPNDNHARYARDHDLPAEGENPVADDEEEEQEEKWFPSTMDYYLRRKKIHDTNQSG